VDSCLLIHSASSLFLCHALWCSITSQFSARNTEVILTCTHTAIIRPCVPCYNLQHHLTTPSSWYVNHMPGSDICSRFLEFWYKRSKYVRNIGEETSMFGPKKVNDEGDPGLTPSFEIYMSINNQTSPRKLKVEVHVK